MPSYLSWFFICQWGGGGGLRKEEKSKTIYKLNYGEIKYVKYFLIIYSTVSVTIPQICY